MMPLAQAVASWAAVAFAAAGILATMCAGLIGVIKWLTGKVDSLSKELREFEKECREDRGRLEREAHRVREQNGEQQRELDGMAECIEDLKRENRGLHAELADLRRVGKQ